MHNILQIFSQFHASCQQTGRSRLDYLCNETKRHWKSKESMHVPLKKVKLKDLLQQCPWPKSWPECIMLPVTLYLSAIKMRLAFRVLWYCQRHCSAKQAQTALCVVVSDRAGASQKAVPYVRWLTAFVNSKSRERRYTGFFFPLFE